MDWKRKGEVRACGAYVIEPASEHYGVIRYRLTGPGGLDELSRNIGTLKDMAADHQRRMIAEAQERRRREQEQEQQRTAIQRHTAEVLKRAEDLLPPGDEHRPDWSALARAELEDRRRKEAAALFAQRQERARLAADPTQARNIALRGRRRGESYPEVHCPGCKADLNADARSFIEDTDLVRYRCVHCGTPSAWDFDTPVPVLV